MNELDEPFWEALKLEYPDEFLMIDRRICCMNIEAYMTNIAVLLLGSKHNVSNIS